MDALTAMKQALEALKSANMPNNFYIDEENNLRAAIQEAEKVNPVAWHYREDLPLGAFQHHFSAYKEDTNGRWEPLYRAKPFAAVSPAPTFGSDRKDLRIADLKAEVMTLRAKLQEVIDPRWILHIRDGGIVASSIKDPLENGDYYIIKCNPTLAG